MKNHSLPSPDYCRQIPSTFSWIDHRLVRDKHITHCSCEALSLYLFLVTVADRKGSSYYSDAKIMQYIPLDRYWIALARDELIKYHLIAYKVPVYQILPLDPSSVSAQINTPIPGSGKRHNRSMEMKNLLAQLNIRRGT